MKIRLRNTKGQVDVIGAISGFILLVVAIMVGLLVVGTLEDSTVGDCTLSYLIGFNDTTVANGTTQTWQAALPYVYSGNSALDGNITINYVNGTTGNCSVAVGGNTVGTLTASDSDTFDVDASYFSNPVSVVFTSCGDQNVTSINASYYALQSCDYTTDAYDAMDTTYAMNYTAMGILPIIILLMAAIAVIGAVLALRGL